MPADANDSTRQTRTFTELLEQRAGSTPFATTDRSTSAESPASPTSPDVEIPRRESWRKSPVPSSELISISALSRELLCKPDRIQALIDNDYIRVMRPGFTPDSTIVARPEKAALNWLRTMLAPIEMRPFLPTFYVARALRMQISTLRAFYIHFNLPMSNDPVFGEVVSPKSVTILIQKIADDGKVKRFDRQAFVDFFISAYTKNPIKLRNYSVIIEREIVRICKMREPDRSIRAANFMAAYKDARTLAVTMDGYAQRMRAPTLDRRIENLRKAIEEDGPWGLPGEHGRNWVGKRRAKQKPVAE